MSAMGRRPIEDIVDEALQSLLEGESGEAVMSRYPGYEEEIAPLLSAATTLKSGPQPQLAQSSLAAMVARAQAQAESGRNTVPVILPATMASADGAMNGTERTVAPRRATPKTKVSKPSLGTRIAAWTRLPAGMSGLPRALALALVLIVSLVIIGRFVGRPQTPFIPVPTVSTQFSLDGTIEKMASKMWVVDGGVVYLETSTQIQGTPSIGSKAHIEGDIAADNRRIARNIKITDGAVPTATVEVKNKPTEQPTLSAITGWATVSPVDTSTTTPNVAENAVPAATAQTVAPPVTSPQGSASPVTIAATVAPKPTVAAPSTATKQLPVLPSSTVPVAPTRTSTTPPAPVTATREPVATTTQVAQPAPTSTVQPSPTAEPSSTPESRPQNTPTSEPTEVPTTEPTEVPTEEPTGTPPPQPTTTPDPTEPPEPEETETPSPTSQPPNTPTTQPTVPPLPSPTRTEDPHETETAEPTQSAPPPTGTLVPTSTSQPSPTQPSPTRTEEPGETQTPQPTEEPHETHTAEPTQGAQP